MNDELTRLLDLPAAARLGIADGELALVTLRHEHADKIIIERQRLGTSIDLSELLEVIGAHGLADVPQLRVSEVAAPQLPAPVEAAPAPPPKARRSTKRQATGMTCSKCSRMFKNSHALEVHQGRSHKEPAATPESPEAVPEPAAAPPAPVAVSEYLCSTCGLSLELHERCADCQGLLGLDHDAGTAAGAFDGRPLCATCVSFRATARVLGIAA